MLCEGQCVLSVDCCLWGNDAFNHVYREKLIYCWTLRPCSSKRGNVSPFWSRQLKCNQRLTDTFVSPRCSLNYTMKRQLKWWETMRGWWVRSAEAQPETDSAETSCAKPIHSPQGLTPHTQTLFWEGQCVFPCVADSSYGDGATML